MKTCIFVVNVQNGFVTETTGYARDRLLNLLNAHIFNCTIFTMFINNPGSPYRRFMNWDKLSTSQETKLVPELRSFASVIFEKNVYTVVNEEVLEYLDKNEIEAVFIAGIDTDCCVLKSAVDFFERNRRVFVLEYYSASNGGQRSHDAAILILERLIGVNGVIRGVLDADRLKCILESGMSTGN